ncbi:ankyrin repeat-containing domain protein [Nemania diffusa]|nr:ankyrin repeat-containing domain protein [Nemania diffusa]
MDPLSVTASVIAIIGTLGAIKKGCKAIANLAKAPQEFSDLISEIESVFAYLEMLHSVLDMGSSTQAFAAVDLNPLGGALSRLDYTTQELRLAIKQAETDSKTSEDGRRISKMKWQVYKSKIMQIRDEVRYRRQDLADKIGLLQLALSVLHTSLLLNTHVKAEISFPTCNYPENGERQSIILRNNKQKDALEVEPRNQIQRCCSVSCPCRCHRPPTRSSQPWLLSTVQQLLSLFMTTAHWESRLCDDKVCRDMSQQKLGLVYQIPLTHHAIWLRLAWTSMFGPGASLHLRVARVVTDYEAFRIAQQGTPEMLQRLFKKRLALPTDITQLGESLLLVAVKSQNRRMIDCLLELGADPFQSNFHSVSPVLLVQYYTMHYPPWTCVSSRLQLLAEEDYNLKSQEYPLHEVLTKGTDAQIQLALDEYPLLVDQLAEFSSTPLHVATRHKRHSAMELLLLRGANPMKVDEYGLIPLHHAIDQDDCKAAEILLRMTSDNELVRLHGYSLLIWTLRYSSSRMLALLLSFGLKPGKLPKK